MKIKDVTFGQFYTECSKRICSCEECPFKGCDLICTFSQALYSLKEEIEQEIEI